MKQYLGVFGLICVIMLGCKSQPTNVITYKLEPKDYSERIFGIGTLQSANNTIIPTPRIPSNSIKVIDLADEGITTKTGDTVCILEASDLQGFYDQIIKEKERLDADVIKLEASNALSLSNLNAQLEEFKAQKRLSFLDSIQMKFSPPEKNKIKLLEEKKNEIQQNKVIRKMKALQKINEQSARALKSQIIQKDQVINQYKEQLDQLVITAPSTGMLIYATSPMTFVMTSDGNLSSSGGGKLKVGATARYGSPLLELPDLDSMQVVLMVQEAEFKRIITGQKVVIKPESMPDFETIGTVKSKSLSSKPLAYRYKVKTYKIIIDIDSLDNTFLPGLSANCEIVVHEEKNKIIVPTISIFEEDSSKFIYVEREELFEKQIIETAKGNPSETIISKGLEGHETIALLEPSMNLIRKQKKDHE